MPRPTRRSPSASPASPARDGGRVRPVLSATVPAELKASLEREARARGLPTLSAAVEQLLGDALAASAESRRGDAMLAQVRRLDLRLARIEADLRARDSLIVELVATLTRVYLGHTPPPAPADREAFKRSAGERFDRLMVDVLARVERGDSAVGRVPELLDGVARRGAGDDADGSGGQDH